MNKKLEITEELVYKALLKWIWYCSLQDVDFLIPKDQAELERMLANIMYMGGMQGNE